MPKFAVILPAAGKSSRFHDKEKKPFINLDGRAVWLRSAEYFVNRPDVTQTIIVISPEDQELFERRYRPNIAFMNTQVVLGGAERFESVANALAKLKPDADFVAIHDAVRPCVTTEQVDAVFNAAAQHGAALLAAPVSETLKQVDGQKKIQSTVAREGLWLAQTPQVFRKDWLLEAYGKRGQLSGPITDDAQLVEAAGHPVYVVPSTATNIKITTKPDLFLAAAILKSRPDPKPNRPIHPFADEEMWK
ncbi:MAG TPA: 2-C-methyl-D-erythritol 4-phosphate cytidylyltransferase [Gemmataceae bacterium]|jgi:2-C-methyl-D-erythritol 4-phosphate cytidylyltransferase|nr:2-C-methyl-D-erythritol 4-phosphate cytidylyltransferase [Gemmataceae bacterium]